MAEYRRFVAYVYEYQKEKKGRNCGVVKVEVRGDICRIELHLQCPGLIPESECSVYGFVRNRGLLDGFLLGSCVTGKGNVECVLETSVKNMGDSEKSLDDMGGMIFVTDQGGFFGTEWDDQTIRPGNFRVVEKKTIPEVQSDLPETERSSEKEIAESKTEESEQDKNARIEQPENVQELNQEDENVQNEKEPEEPDQQDRNMRESQELHSQSVQESEISEQAVEKMPREPVKPHPHHPLPGTPCDAFPDGELSDCRKISPQDLCHLGRRACMLRNNRFVQYGSYNFGHLLLCRNNCGQMILGVPGGYDQQERFMANMFGFPYFKESHHIQIPGGRGGYWYRLIDSADSNNRNGRQ